MGSTEYAGYCSFTKAIEHLGDRWILLIVRQLAVHGSCGFNDLANGLPGRISRSVLADRLHRLETLGLIGRSASGYRLTAIGNGLVPTLLTLREWADTWLPEDAAMVERDPDILLGWLAQRTVRERLPARTAVVELHLSDGQEQRYWLVLQRDAQPYGCLKDPFLDPLRYLYVEAPANTLLSLARGRYSWTAALEEGAISVDGDPRLRRLLPEWFDVEADAPVPVQQG